MRSCSQKCGSEITANTASQSPGAISASGAMGPTVPALLKAISSPPNSSFAAATSVAWVRASDTSPATQCAFPPNAAISCATLSRPASPRAFSTSDAPSRAKSNAAARPIPDDAPVMIATLSFKLVIVNLHDFVEVPIRASAATQLSVSCVGRSKPSRRKIVSRSVSRVLYGRACARRGSHSSGTDVATRLVQPTRTADPETDCRPLRTDAPSLFGFAPDGVYRAVCIAADAVGSYPTLSPLPRHPCRFVIATVRKTGRSAFCGTVPGVTPAGRYPASCFHGARTFLTCRLSAYDRRGCPTD